MAKKLKAVGFSLIELMIVVAIIGILATVGVPTFRRMVQKAKKSEAKISLGGLFTANSAFQSEYGGYGNNLTKLGFDLTGTNLIYVVGFPQTNCSSAGFASIAPQSGGNFPGTNIAAAYPSYYTAATFSSVAGNAVLTVCNNGAGVIDANGATYTAFANGVIAPGLSPTAPGAGVTDIWSMNDQRVLANTQDGVQ